MMRKNNNNRNKHRGGGGRRYQGGGGGGNRGNDGQNIARQKHHATQQREKYSNLARDAQVNGDRVDVEYYLQHVDHYNRVLTDISAIEAERHAHMREHTLASSGGEGGQESTSGEGGESAPEGGEQPSAADGQGEAQPRPQQRHQRPRRQYPDNGAAEANSNTSEIPLPGGILPPV